MARSARILLCLVGAAAGCRLSTEPILADDAGPPDPDAAPAIAPDAAAGLPSRAGNSLVSAENDVVMRAQFWAGSSGPGSCINEEVAGCTLRACEDLPDTGRASAGSVTVASPGSQAILTPDERGRYGTTDEPITWRPGEPIRFTAEGDAVPAFDETLTGPPTLETLIAPATANSSATISRGEPLPVEWTGGAGAPVSAYVTCYSDETTRLQLRCGMPDGASSGSVPSAALTRLPAGCADGLFFLAAEDFRFIEPGGGYLVKLSVRGPSLRVDLTLE